MIIRDHCLPGAYNNREGWVPPSAWPDDCIVQWGGRGVVFQKDGSYTTAFFEAFPTDPQTFIRGEGATIADAELDAFAKWERIVGCSGHEMARRGYTNGAGICSICGLFQSGVFPELPPEGPPSLLNRLFSGDPEVMDYVIQTVIDEDIGPPK